MATVIKQDGTGDYTSINAWLSDWANIPGSTAEDRAGEIQDANNYDESFALSFAGDATLYQWLRVHPDFRQSGIPGTSHARVDRNTDADVTIVTLSGNFARIDGLEIQRRGATSNFRRHFFVTGNNCLISRCLCWADPALNVSTNLRGVAVINVSVDLYIENCIFTGFSGNSFLLQHTTGTHTARIFADHVTLVNNAFGPRINTSVGTTGIIEAYNCSSIGNASSDWSAVGAGTSTLQGDYNASLDTSAAGANALHGVVAADQFVSLNTAAPDLHLLSTAVLRNSGIDRSAVFPDARSNLAVDIDGDVRPQGATSDIGADEFAEAVVAAPFIPKIMWV